MKGSVQETVVTLASLAGGAALERFQLELERVLSNIADPNTDATAKREITLKFRITPDRDRYSASVDILTSAKLAATIGAGTTVYMGRREGELVAVESNPQQLTFDVQLPTPGARAKAPAQGDGKEG